MWSNMLFKQAAVCPFWHIWVHLCHAEQQLWLNMAACWLTYMLSVPTDWCCSSKVTVVWLDHLRVWHLSCSITGHISMCRCKVSACAPQISCYARPGISCLKFWRQWETLRKPQPAARRWQTCCPAPTQAIALLLLTKDCAWLACLGRSMQAQKQTVNVNQAWESCICILVPRSKHKVRTHLKSYVFQANTMTLRRHMMHWSARNLCM